VRYSRKEKTMKRLTLILCIALLNVAGFSVAQQQVERKGITSKVKHEQVISGHLAELNGKYKLRITELTFEPGGYIGEHQHAGPGIRYVVSGELTLDERGKITTYKTGEYFYESGEVTNAAYNRTKSPVTILQYEILPAALEGGSAVPPK
jgi:quercetin dioxygenase-like cupin family protein